MIDRVNVRKAVVHLTLPIVCSKCGITGESEPIKVEVSHSSLAGLNQALQSTRLGTHFPVGWAKHLRNGKDELDCPVCVH